MTIKELEDILIAERESWSEMDQEHLGNFEDQEVYFLGKEEVIRLGDAEFHGEFGLMFQEES